MNKLKKHIKITNIIKSYILLCEVTGEDVKTGSKAKAYHLKEMERYFYYHKSGNEFVIDGIYSKPLKKIETRGKSEGSKGNNNIYGKYIEKLVLDLLVEKYQTTQERNVCLSRDIMLNKLGMVNKNYSYGKFNRKALANFINADINNVREFYMLNNKNLYETVERAFSSLANKCLVSWGIVTTVACGKTEFSVQEASEQDIEIPSTETHTTATRKERDIILYAEKSILKSMKLASKKDVFLLDKYNEFNKDVCALLKKTSNIKYYYKSYEVVFHEMVVDELVNISKWILEQEEKQNVKVTLNGILSNNMVINSETRQSKAIKVENNINKYKQIKTERRIDDTYVEDNKNIVDTVICIGKGDMTDKMKRDYKEKGVKKIASFDKLFV